MENNAEQKIEKLAKREAYTSGYSKISDISAKVVLKKWFLKFKKENPSENMMSWEEAQVSPEIEFYLKAMEEYASIVNERKDSVDWINVKDKLPDIKKDGNKVLLFREMNESQEALSICVHDTSMIKYCEKSSYWMPLPAPPIPKIK